MSAISDLNNLKAQGQRQGHGQGKEQGQGHGQGQGHSSRHLSNVCVTSVESTVAVSKLSELQGIRMTMMTNTKFYINFLI
jgi:hypothetical protein